jgi:predicted Zn finger-like uncharacterized protein
MAVVITCPQCNYTRSIPDEKIPPRIRWVRCPRCGARFEFVRGAGHEEEKMSLATPWEQREHRGLWKGVTGTIRGVLFSPKNTFSSMPVTGGWREPLAFGLLTGSIGSMFSFFWEFTALLIGLLKPLWGVSLPISSPLVFLVLIFLSPLFVMIHLFISSVIIHALLLLVRGGKNGYEATFRVVAYSQATRTWSVIPLLGDVIGWIWRSAVYIIGLKEAHETSYARVILAFSLPFALLFVLISALVLLVIHSIVNF